ncbi:hypothetical protein AB3S75_034513 [Citrus x aurantiifolia]
MQKNIRKCLRKSVFFYFLQGLNSDLDEVRGRLLGMKPFPTLRESFAEVRREESRKRVMMNPSNQDTPSLEARGSALIANKQDDGHISQSKDKIWCDYYKKPYHTRETCWDLHGKPPNWKPKKQRKQTKLANIVESNSRKVAGFNFSTEQVEILWQLLNQTKVSAGSESQNSNIPTAAMA